MNLIDFVEQRISPAILSTVNNASFYLADYSRHSMSLNHSRWIPSISINLYLLTNSNSWMTIRWSKALLSQMCWYYLNVKYWNAWYFWIYFSEYISLLNFKRQIWTNDSTANVYQQALPMRKRAYHDRFKVFSILFPMK